VIGVQLKKDPPLHGGFAEVYQGIYKSKPVALKVLRVRTTDPDQKAQKLAKVGSHIILEKNMW
jgi:serine/threonine protein kinase